MTDQRGDVITFIRDKHPELSADDVGKVVDAITEWLDTQTEDDDGNGS